VHPNERGASLLALTAAALLADHGIAAPPHPGAGDADKYARTPFQHPTAHNLSSAGLLMPVAMPRFMIHTHHRTIIYADLPSGRLRHGPGSDVPHNVFLLAENGIATLVRTDADGGYAEIKIRPEGPHAAELDTGILTAEGFAATLQIIRISDATPQTISLRGATLYLCAEPAGEVSLNRYGAGPWETFRLESDDT